MVNILVVEDDMIQSQHLINIVSRKIEEVKLYNMSINGKEAFEIIDKGNADIILLDLNLPDISGIEILSYISDSKIEKYQNSIIVISGDSNLINQLPSSCYSYICAILHKPVNYDELIYKLWEIVKYKNKFKSDNIIKIKINKELEYLRFNFSHNGTRYLAETIFELYSNRTKFLDNFKRDIFPILAQRHHKSVNTIEGNIKQAINCMFFDCTESALIEYFNYPFIMKPKLKEISYTILNKLF